MRVQTVDYHTAGEPFRIVVGGGPLLQGHTIMEKRRWAQANCDDVRRLLVNEPRGHADMYGCFVTEPEDGGADLGVVFFHNAGFSTACGHGTIALVTWAIEHGMVPIRAAGGASERAVVVDVPSGRLTTVATITETGVAAVRFRNVPAFVHSRALPVGRFTVDIAYGGAFYAIVPAAQAGLRVERRHLPALIELGRGLKQHIEAAVSVAHPQEPEISGIYGVIFTEGMKNVTVFADGEVDRSPCGSGTSARLALLDATGELERGLSIDHRGIVGTSFRGRVVGEEAGGLITEVEGSAHLTGRHEFILQPEDELGTGFQLR
ncbi:MAG: proline racemase family protein [Candidatus Dormibacteraeota bacterium]|nr:proline racemase family protein [Candidatus Dormibacteraeota bacterium]